MPTRPSLFELADVGAQMRQLAVDVRDGAATRSALAQARPEVVLHLAAQPMVRRSLLDPVMTYEVNVMGTVNVLEAVRELGREVLAVVVVTSDKCYENPPGGSRRFVEGDALGGADPYSSSKACAELVAGAYRRSFFSADEPPRLASARAGNVIGGGDWGEDRLVPDAVRAVETATPLLVRNPHAVRPWQHVLSPLSGYLQLAQLLARDDTQPAADAVQGAWNFGPAEARRAAGELDRAAARRAVGRRARVAARRGGQSARGRSPGARLERGGTIARLVAGVATGAGARARRRVASGSPAWGGHAPRDPRANSEILELAEYLKFT